MHLDRRVEAAEADQVVEVVDVVRIEVVLAARAEIGVIDPDFLEVRLTLPQLLVDVVGRHHGAVREVHFFPVQRYSAKFLFVCSHD